MGEITDFVTLYIEEESGILEDKAAEISRVLESNIKDVIAPGKVGYDTGHLHGTVQGDYDLDGRIAWVTGWYSAEYGKYWYRWKDGTDFLQDGLEKTLEAYR